MSENNLANIISMLSSNKDFTNMVEKVKESGDLDGILNEVSSLLSVQPSKNDEDRSSKEGRRAEGEVSRQTENDPEAGKFIAKNDEFDASSEASSQLSSILQNNSSRNSDTEQGGNDISGLSSLFGGLLPLFTSSVLKSSSLLIALKPYLSKKRCDLIDNIIRLSKLASIVSLTK